MPREAMHMLMGGSPAGARGHARRARELRRLGSRADDGFPLAALDPERFERLLAQAARRHHRSSSVIFREGDLGDSLLVVATGHAKLIVPAGGRELLLAIVGARELLTDLAVVDGRPHRATAVALDDVEVASIRGPEVLSLLEQEPGWALLLIRLLDARVRESDRRRVELATLDALGRVGARLVELAERFGGPEADGVRIDLPLSQEELAAWAGTSYKAATTALQRMRGLGWIDTGRRSIALLDMEAIRGCSRSTP